MLAVPTVWNWKSCGDFQFLRAGGQNRSEVDAVVYQAGRLFESGGKNFLPGSPLTKKIMSNALDFFTIAGQRRYHPHRPFQGSGYMALTSASVEKYLRSNFGRHYVYMLVSALLLSSFAPV